LLEVRFVSHQCIAEHERYEIVYWFYKDLKQRVEQHNRGLVDPNVAKVEDAADARRQG